MGNFGETTDLLMLVNNELTRLHSELITHTVKSSYTASENSEITGLHAEWSKERIAFLHQALADALGAVDFTKPVEVIE